MTTPPITAIPTRYAGCHFRSRLEARWAVFFDHLDISWQYEPQGYLVNGKPYLPDFYLPKADLWVEVKGTEGEYRNHINDHRQAAAELGSLLMLGSVPDAEKGLPLHTLWLAPHGRAEARVISGGWLASSADRLRLFMCDPVGGLVMSGMVEGFPPQEPALGAYMAARRARFEHGETPERPR